MIAMCALRGRVDEAKESLHVASWPISDIGKSLMLRQRSRLPNSALSLSVGRERVTELLQVVADPSDKRVPEVARAGLAARGNQLLSIKDQIVEFDRMIMDV